MSFLFPEKIFSVMDVGADKVLIVTAKKKSNGQIALLASGESALRGLEKGQIVHFGDFVESVAEAAGNAEKSGGAGGGKLYYNLDDPAIQSVWRHGSRILDGEGEIQSADVSTAVRSARRLAGDFENKIIYAAEIDYVIDDKDPVKNPVGIFGHKLDVKVHVLLARADRLDIWSRLIRRAGFKLAVPVLSGLACAYGVLNEKDRRGKKIIWDLGRDYYNGLVIDGLSILEYRTLLGDKDDCGHLSGVVLALCQDFQKKYADITEVILTGELSDGERLIAELKNGLEIPVKKSAPYGMTKLNESAQASIAGLIRLAAQMEGRTSFTKPEKSLLTGTREKVHAFLSDYF